MWIDVAVKAAVLLGTGAVVELLLRRASAAARHVVWVSVLAGALAVALASPVVPRWSIEVAAIDPAPVAALFRANAVAGAANASAPAGTGAAPASSAKHGIPWSALAVWLWAAGAALVVARMAAGAWAIRRRVRRAGPAPAAIAARAAQLARGVRAEVLLAPGPVMPLTFGVFRPKILLPAGAPEWPGDRLDAVLLHELAHVRRRDTSWQALADLACALYWPNPLAWYGRRRALLWRERAADDSVLACGARPSDYAANLLEIARALAVPRLCGSAAIARRSQMEGRLLAILDGRANRSAASRRLAGAAAAAALAAVLGLAGLDPLLARNSSVQAEAEAALQEFDFERAAARYRDLLVETERRHGPDSPEFARVLVKTAAAVAPLDERAAAQALERAAAIFAAAGPDDPAHADALYRLGAYVLPDGSNRAAELYGRALEVARRSGADAVTARVLHNLAVLAPKAPEAERYLREAVEIETRLDRPMLLAGTLEILARVLRDDGRGAEAGDAAEQARQVRERAAQRKAAAPPLPGGTYRVGGGVQPPRLVFKQEPAYSGEARAARLQGTVVLRVVVGPDGVARNVRVIRSLGLGLDEKAVHAIRQWRFEPGTRDGQPVNVAATIEVNFRLSRTGY